MIYGLQISMDDRRIKIGTTKQGMARIYAQDKECILFLVDGDRSTEGICHALLAPYRLGKTEHFIVPDKVLIELRSLGMRGFSGLTYDQRHKFPAYTPIPGFDF